MALPFAPIIQSKEAEQVMRKEVKRAQDYMRLLAIRDHVYGITPQMKEEAARLAIAYHAFIPISRQCMVLDTTLRTLQPEEFTVIYNERPISTEQAEALLLNMGGYAVEMHDVLHPLGYCEEPNQSLEHYVEKLWVTLR